MEEKSGKSARVVYHDVTEHEFRNTIDFLKNSAVLFEVFLKNQENEKSLKKIFFWNCSKVFSFYNSILIIQKIKKKFFSFFFS